MRDSVVHRRAPHCKIIAAGACAIVIVATPRTQVWAFLLHATIVTGVAIAAHVPLSVAARRMSVGLPFLVCAAALPFFAAGDRIEIGLLEVSEDGLWAAWNIVAKGALGLAVAAILTATTPVAELIKGLGTLKVPTTIIGIVTFMVRYVDVVIDDIARMRVARLSRGADERWFWQWTAIAAGAGTLFVRSYERGERVHLAMRARGFDGAMPRSAVIPTPRMDWILTMTVPLAAAIVAAAALGLAP